jgi:cell wall-associated NlpC family hydrolase
MPPLSLRTTPLRALAGALLLTIALAVGAGMPAPGHADVAADRAAASSLKDRIAAESAKIAKTNAGLAAAQERLDALQARANARQQQLKRTQDALIRARAHLARLEKKAAAATKQLSQNLVAAYEAGKPELVSVVLDSKGFADLLERVDFYKKVSKHNGTILDITRRTKQAVAADTVQLDGMRARFTKLAAAAVADRNQAQVVQAAILTRQQEQLAARSHTSSQLANVRSRIRKVEREQAAAAKAAASTATATQDAPPISGGGGDVVSRVIAAANQIATLPYVWGGGHGSFQDSGYDCSGSVSYALAGGGLLSSPLDSTGLESWGEPGPGRRITVYANAGHAFMVIDGRRFDTVALSGGGTRWSSTMVDTSAFVARHPPGL